jgi:hypothetical protein
MGQSSMLREKQSKSSIIILTYQIIGTVFNGSGCTHRAGLRQKAANGAFSSAEAE